MRLLLVCAALFAVGCDGGADAEVPEGRVYDILGIGSSDAADGEPVYSSTCAVCHGAEGQGGAGSALATVVPSLSDEEIIDIILNGTSGMIAYDGQLTDQQIADVFAYLRVTFQ